MRPACAALTHRNQVGLAEFCPPTKQRRCFEHLRFLFRLLDSDDDGLLGREDLQRVTDHAAVVASGGDPMAGALAPGARSAPLSAFFRELQETRLPAVDFAAFVALECRHPDLSAGPDAIWVTLQPFSAAAAAVVRKLRLQGHVQYLARPQHGALEAPKNATAALHAPGGARSGSRSSRSSSPVRQPFLRSPARAHGGAPPPSLSRMSATVRAEEYPGNEGGEAGCEQRQGGAYPQVEPPAPRRFSAISAASSQYGGARQHPSGRASEASSLEADPQHAFGRSSTTSRSSLGAIPPWQAEVPRRGSMPLARGGTEFAMDGAPSPRRRSSPDYGGDGAWEAASSRGAPAVARDYSPPPPHLRVPAEGRCSINPRDADMNALIAALNTPRPRLFQPAAPGPDGRLTAAYYAQLDEVASLRSRSPSPRRS